MSQLIEHAGLQDRVKIFVGKSTWTIPKVKYEARALFENASLRE